MLSDRSS